MKDLKQGLLNHVIAIALLLLAASVYFYPELQGKKILSHDQVSAASSGRQFHEYQEKGKTILWGTTIFSGMPLFQVAYNTKTNILDSLMFLRNILPKSMWLWFSLLLGFYICLSLLEFKPQLSVIGALAFGLSTWFFLSIEAGHSTKIITTSFIPPLLASILITYKGKWLLGGVLAGLFTSLAVMSNHPQVVYYTIFLILTIILVKFIQAIKEKKISIFIKRSLILLIFAVLGILPNAGLLWTTFDYSHETIRGGKSELTTKDAVNQSTGLDIDYAMQWSYGKAETINLLIPGAFAGGSKLDENSETYQNLVQKGVPKNQALNYVENLPLYYGSQPFTTGPSYMGAAIIFLFFLLFFISTSNLRWVYFFVVIISVSFSWGNNFLIVNEFFFNHFPLYNKFRTPSMWLVLTMIITVLGAMSALKIILDKQAPLPKIKKGLIYTFSILGSFSLLTWLLGGEFFSFEGSYDSKIAESGVDITTLIDDRISILKSDALRTFVILGLLFGLLWMIIQDKIKNISITYFCLAILIAGDLWSVGKRYLNDDDFSKATSFEKSIRPTQADLQILNDKSYYRVFNQTLSSFNDNSTSYFHNSVGGYHAAKLIRYQDLIENHLSKGNMNVFNMLNTKYFIGGQPGQEIAQQNPSACGVAWFVDNLKWVKNADEEMAELTNFLPQSTAIIDERFKSDLQNFMPNNSTQNKIELTSFYPDKMIYSSEANTTNYAVFSEIWYKGNEDWKVFIDGVETKFQRVNYLLRGLKIPGGKHEVIFEFHPKIYYIGSEITRYSSIFFALLIIAVLMTPLFGKKLPGMQNDSDN